MFVMSVSKRLCLNSELIFIKKQIATMVKSKMADFLILDLERMELEYIRLVSKNFNMIYGLFWINRRLILLYGLKYLKYTPKTSRNTKTSRKQSPKKDDNRNSPKVIQLLYSIDIISLFFLTFRAIFPFLNRAHSFDCC